MKFITILALIVFLLTSTAITVQHIQFKQGCSGYLKRAADANSVEMAKGELNKAVAYLEDKQLTSGYTSVLYRTPDEDIAFFYGNLKTCQKELSKVNDSTSALEKSNLLIKLRETLLDNGKNGTEITYPDGLSRYPNNALWGWLFWVSLVALIIGCVALGIID